MNRIIKLTTFFLFVGYCSITKAQSSYGKITPVFIEPYPITVTMNQTTNLLFHYRIKNVDRGSADIIVSQANDTALLVKANRMNFTPTNLSVYTADGKLYAFTVGFAAEPAHLAMVLQLTDSGCRPDPVTPEVVATEDAFAHCSSKVAGQAWHGKSYRDKDYGISLRLKGIAVKANVLFFCFELHNHSKLGYDISSLRFFICDAKRAKRVATQEMELQPVYVFGNAEQIPGKSRHTVVFTLPKFTLPEKKFLKIQLQEQSGGRNLELRLHNQALMNAESLP
jgi:conjugative transposon TraN protein